MSKEQMIMYLQRTRRKSGVGVTGNHILEKLFASIFFECNLQSLRFLSYICSKPVW